MVSAQWYYSTTKSSVHIAYETAGQTCTNGTTGSNNYRRCTAGGCTFYMYYGRTEAYALQYGCVNTITNSFNYCGESSKAGLGCWCDDACCAYNDCCWDNVRNCKAPLIDGVQPSRAPTGPLKSTIITLTGDGFACRDMSTTPQAYVTMHNMRGAARPADNISPNAYVVPTSTMIATTQLYTSFYLPEDYGPNWYFILRNCYFVVGPASADLFSYNVPSLEGLSPTTGATRGGKAVLVLSTMQGTSFGNTVPLTAGLTVARYYCTLSNGSTGVFSTVYNTNMTVTNHTKLIFYHPAGEGTCSVSLEVSSQSVSVSRLSFAYQPPTITSVTPSVSLTPGTSITLRGQNFGVTPSVTVADISCPVTSSTVDGTTEVLVCTLPLGYRVSQPVVVAAGGQRSNVVYVSYAAPVISIVSPSTGPTAGSTAVTLTGTGFYISGSMIFGGTTYASTNTTMFTSWTTTQIVFKTPAGQGKNVAIYLIVGDQLSATPGAFSYNAPVITNATPNPGASGATLTLTGTDFGTSGSVAVSGLDCAILTHATTQITCTIPTGYGNNKAILVTISSQSSNSYAWSYPAPVVSTVSPLTGGTQGGYSLTITGQYFGDTGSLLLGTSALATSGINCVSSSWTTTKIVCELASGSGKNLYAIVASGGQTGAAPAGYLFSYGAPTVTSVTPLTGPTSGGTQLIITGTNYGSSTVAQAAGVVTIRYDSLAGGANCTLQSRDHTQLLCSTSIGYGSNHPIVVVVDGQTASGSFLFTYSAPTITLISGRTSTTNASPVQVMTIIGTSFGASAGTVLIGASSYVCTVVTWTHTQITCNIGAGVGTGLAVKVTMGYNASVSITDSVNTVSYNAPTLSSVTPNSISSAGGVPVTIVGSNFGASGATVTIDGYNCPVTAQNHTNVVCTAPSGWGSGLNLILTIAGQTSNSVTFSYKAPTLSTVTVQGLTTVGAVPITLTGDSFGPGTAAAPVSVTVGTRDCPVTSQSHTQIICTLPPGAGTMSVQVKVDLLVSNYVNYKYAVPTISSISTACHPTRGGSLLTITGLNFGATAPSIKVSNRDCLVTTYDSVTHKSVICETPQNEGLNQPVLLTSGGESATVSTLNSCAPAVTAVTTTDGLFPTSAHTITVVGTNFASSGIVSVNGYVCSSPVRGNAASDSTKDQIVCSVIAGAGKNLPLTVTVSGQISPSFPFTYDAPVLTAATMYASATGGGATVTLTGKNFGPSGLGTATLGGRACTPTSNGWTHTQIACALPAGQGVGLVYMVSRASEDATLTSPVFNYNPPTLTSISPSSVPTAGAIPITLTGTNFGLLGSATVYVQDQSALAPTNRSCSVTFQTHTQIVCSAPMGYRAAVTTTVNVSTQIASLSSSYGYDLPNMYALSPSMYSTGGSSGSTDYMTITGASFGEDAGLVMFMFSDVGTTNVSGTGIVSWTHANVVVKVPAGSGTSIPVRVVTSVGRAHTTQTLTYSYAAASLSAISPTNMPTGPTGSGSRVLTITGLSFGPSQGSSTVTVGGLACAVLTWSHSSITCTVPEGQGMNLPVIVTVSGKEANHMMFSFNNPAIASITPQYQTTNGGVAVTIAGTSFGTPATAATRGDAAVVVSIGGTDCPIVGGTYTHEQIICTLPPGVGTKNGVTVKVGVQLSDSIDYAYASPQFVAITPSTVDSEGGQLTLAAYQLGSNLALISTTIGGQVCTMVSTDFVIVDPTGESPLKSFVCSLPAGSGTNLALALTVSDITINVANAFSYSPPYNVVVAPLNAPSIGGNAMSFIGSSMSASPSFRIGSNLCTNVQTQTAHKSYLCTLVAGQGTGLAMSIVVGSTTYPLNGTFSYDPPVITAATPLTGATAGGTVLTITGTSLGTIGTVTIGGTVSGNTISGGTACAVVSGSYTHTSVRCVVAAGTGQNLPVHVESGGQIDVTSPVVQFSYAAPSITSIAPTNGPATGDTTDSPYIVTINGANFGFSELAVNGTSFVTIGGAACVFSVWTHTRIECKLPPGFDEAAVLVSVGSPPRTATSTYQYKLPALTNITPLNGPTSGAPITLIGTNFGDGTVTRTFYTTLTGAAAEIPITPGTATMTQVLATVGEGVGRNLPFNVYVSYNNNGNLRNRSLSTSMLFSYDAPTVTAIASTDCTASDSNTRIVDCPVQSAGITVTITGTNFGAPAPHAKPAVMISSTACTVTSWTHTQIICSAAGVVGYELDVRVTQSESIATFVKAVSFKGPKLGDIILPTDGVITSTYDSQEVRIAVTDAPDPFQNVTVTFGPTSDPTQFVCSSPTYVAGTPSYISCTVPPGVGMNLVFVARFNLDGSLYQVSQSSTGTIKYPAPEFVDASIAAFSTPSNRVTGLVGTVSQGQLIIFDMKNTGVDASLIKIYYNNANYEDECTGVQFYSAQPSDTTTRTLQCATKVSQGAPYDGYHFSAVLLNQNSTVQSTFSYAYPEPPVVTRVTTALANCAVDSTGDGITNCLTAGNFVITVIGSKFPPTGAGVRIGQYDCPVSSNNATTILCTLPTGVGRNLAVVVTSGSTFSTARRLVSYASPAMLTITGCTASGVTQTVDCSRTATPTITVTGTNFGPSGATIYLGDNVVNAIHDASTPNSKVTFTLPSGFGLERSLLMVQAGGSSGSGVFVSYAKCPMGTHETTTIACQNCAAGYFSATTGAAACSPCNPGTYQPDTGKTECVQCAIGTYSATLASTVACAPCAAGYTAATAGLTQCSPCGAGTYRSTAMSACVACTAGKYASAVSAATSCVDCTAGTFSIARAVTCNSCSQGTYSAAGAAVCTSCAVGKVQPLTGQSSCTNCVAGTYMPNTGQAVCLACGDGTMSAPGASTCTNCAKGKYSARAALSTVGPTSCTDCAIGYYSENDGQAACNECPAGRYIATTGKSACTLCAAGYYNAQTARTVCDKCAAGSYQDVTGSAVCKQCEAGKAQSLTAQSSCTSCPLGQYAESPGMLACVNCVAGKYADVVGSPACVACTSGTYADQPGSAECTECAAGTAALRVGETLLTSCTSCAAGKFSPATAQAVCTDCPVGSIGAGTGYTVCSSCVAGKYNNEVGMSVCKTCTAGYFSASGASSCSPCPVGRYTASSSALTCSDCAAGRFSATPGSSTCTDCQPGRFIGVAGQAACIECPAGRFSSAAQPTTCELCPAGKYQTEPGSSTCIDCAPGTYSSAAGQASCMPCARGEYAGDSGSQSCTSCAAGKFAESEGMDSCTACAIGQYAPTPRLASCLACPAGSVSTATGATVCALCAVGKYQSIEGSSVCTNCEIGRYAPTQGLHTCIACKAGTFQNTTGTSACRRCAIGTYTASSGLSACINCDAGRYAPAQEAVTCLACPRGNYQPLQGQSECLPCPTGQVQPASGQSVCADCLQGTYQAMTGQGSCTLCSSGEYQDTAAASSCKQCEPETYSVVTNTTAGAWVCTACPNGTSQPNPGQASCAVCGPGTYITSAGCTLCPAGQYQDLNGQASCKVCEAGYYAPDTGMLACLPCGIGTFNNATEMTQCYKCAVGQYQDLSAATFCKDCSAGSVTSTTGQAVCGTCPRGTYDATAVGSPRSVCTPCAAGKFQTAVGSTTCTKCAIGRFSANVGQVECVECPQGKYSDTLETIECTPCAAGRYTDVTGTLLCAECAAGRFAPETGSFSCVNCPAGKIQSTTGQSECVDCVSGTYNDAAGRSVCTQCGPGTYAGGAGVTACNNCAPGEYSAGYGLTACTACAVGTYQPNRGRSACDSCSAGRFAPLEHAVSCSACAPGTYTNVDGKSVCDECAAGKYQFSSGMSTCDNCSAGSYNAKTRQTRCLPCTSGTYAGDEGLTKCDDCTPGTYSQLLGSIGPTVCTDCAMGRYQIAYGQGFCLQCQPGRFSNVTGAQLCEQCALGSAISDVEAVQCDLCSAGSYSSREGAMVCTECGVGYYSAATGSSSCAACGAGKYQDVSGGAVCKSCSAGYYQTEAAQSYCLACPLGKYGTGDGITCTECPTGRFSNRMGASECEECPSGSYQNEIGQASCMLCSPGTYTDVAEATQCTDCPIGKSQPFAGGEGCLPCEEGTYSLDVGQSRCLSCAPGTFNNATESTSCSTCVAGKYQAVQGQTVCNDCPAGRYAPANAVECTVCENGMANELTGQATCVLCDPIVSVPNKEATACDCIAGYYLADYTNLTTLKLEAYVPGYNKFVCQPCPTGADCSNVGSKWTTLLTSAGWWRATNESSEFYRCSIPDYCPGGIAQASTFDETSGSVCASGRQGVMCSECAPGMRTGIGGICEACPDDAGSYIVMIIVLIIIVALLLLSIWLLWKAGEDMLKSAQAAPKQEDDVTQDSDDLYEDSDNDGERKTKDGKDDADMVSESLDSESEAVVVDNIDPYSPAHINRMLPGPPLPPPNFTYKLKIFLSFIQIATHIGTGLEIQWPSTFKSFILFFDFLNFDYIFSSITSAECYDAVNYYSSYVVFVCLPAAIVAFVLLFWILPRHFNLFCFRHQDVFARMRSKMRSWLIILYALFLLYPIVSSTILNHYVCKTIRDSENAYSFLLVDLSVTCKTDTWWLFAYIGFPLILVYPIGIPAFFFGILYTHRKQLHMSQVQAQFGFLYAGYRDATWWWELADTFHKLIQTSILAFLPLLAQLPFGMGVAIVYLMAILLFNPYLRKEDDALAMLCQNLIFLLMLAGYFFQIEENVKLSTSEDVGMTLCLLFAAGVFLAAFVYYLGRALVLMAIELRQKFCPKKTAPKDLKNLEADEAEADVAEGGEVIDEEAFTSDDDDDETSGDSNNGMGEDETEPSVSGSGSGAGSGASDSEASGSGSGSEDE